MFNPCVEKVLRYEQYLMGLLERICNYGMRTETSVVVKLCIMHEIILLITLSQRCFVFYQP